MQSSLRSFWLPVIGFWLLIALLLVGRYWLQVGTIPLLSDTDDAMRMVTAADLLNGQSWQDLTQPRDNTPFGASLHWSRLIDAPIALLMAIAGPGVAAIAWPLLLLLVLLALSVAVTRALVDKAGVFAALALPALTLVLNIEFSPGRVDHHNVQIVLVEGMLLAMLLGRRQVRGAALAAVLGATSLAVGLETLPLVLAAVAIYALLWLGEPDAYRRALGAFGLGFALAMAAHFLLATEPALYWVAACDTVSIVYVLAAAAGGAALAAAALLGSRWGLAARTMLLLALGVASLAPVIALYPQCLSGPYADVDVDIVAGLFQRIPEAQPLWMRFAIQPVASWALVGAPLLALPLTAWVAWREHGERRIDWLIVLGLLATACLVSILQVRGARLTAALALPAAVWLITTARSAYLQRGGLAGAAGLVASWLAFATTIQFFLFQALAGLAPTPALAATGRGTQPQTCLIDTQFRKLAELPQGRVAAPIGLSSHILHYTPHAVLSAGFHRNTQGIKDVVAFFSHDEATARRIADERGLDYVVICPGALEGEVPWAEGGGQWSWLRSLSNPDEVLQIYRITPGH